MGAHAHEHGVEALPQKGARVGHALAAAQLDTGLGVVALGDLQDRGDLGVHGGVGQAVGGDAVAHLAADLLVGLEDHDLVALLGAVESGREARGAGADDGDLLAGQGLVAHVGPPLARVSDGGGALETADRQRGAVELVALAGALAVVDADVAQALGERNLLADHGGGAGELALANEPQVARDVDVGRAALAARHDVVGVGFALVEHVQRVHNGARGAHLDARPAEAAARLLQAHVSVGADADAPSVR